MQLIIPMAGQGRRMRPHTLTTPKPLIPIAGEPIVARLVSAIQAASPTPIETIGFVVSEMPPPALQASLTTLAECQGATARFYIQQTAQGTAHAILCAADLLRGPVMVAFADTLFQGLAPLVPQQENTIWVKQVGNPAAFGVIKTDEQQRVLDFIEKPQDFVSDLAIIGIYYFQQAEQLHQALQALVTQTKPKAGEYLLTDALKAMHTEGIGFVTNTVAEWLDCGNKEATLHTNERFLSLLQGKEALVADTAVLHNSVVIPPVYLGAHVHLTNAVVGPYVSIGDHSKVVDSRIENSIVQSHSTIESATLKNSMVGNHVCFTGQSAAVSIGDYTTISQD